MEKNPATKTFRRKILILRIIGFVFLAFQLLGYLGATESGFEGKDTSEKIAYILGYNFCLWIALAFFYWSWNIHKAKKRAINADLINSIGEKEL